MHCAFTENTIVAVVNFMKKVNKKTYSLKIVYFWWRVLKLKDKEQVCNAIQN